MKRISFDRVAQIYDISRGLPKHVMKQLFETLSSELSGYRRVLDAGVGTGRFAKPLQDEGFRVVGVDIAKKMMSKAVEKGVNNLLLGDVCFLPFKDNSFDATICIHLLHLIGEWKMALEELCRVTQNTYISIIYVYSNPMWETYDRLLKKYGYEKRRLGKGEWELEDLIKPSRSVFVASFETGTDKRLKYLRQRAYSHQWEIPANVNEKVVDELESQFAGKLFRQEMRLLVWNIDNLKAYCEKEKM